MVTRFCHVRWLTLCVVILLAGPACAADVVRVFIFAGQSNMEGADSKVADIKRFPPFAGLEQPQADVRFSYCIGRQNKAKSTGWVDLQSVKNMVGPELSFARKVSQTIDDPIAIIKVAAGGTHLGGDWNPDEPSGFKMYPLALQWVRDALESLKQQGVEYQLEGFMWHQGENDMFNEGYLENYGANLERFIGCWRRDLQMPKLRFYVGELNTKTIWGMDLRPRMYKISLGQKQVAAKDPLVDYVPTSHVGVEIGGGVGLHYHYGTLGQLEHGENYADAYLKSIGKFKPVTRKLADWPYQRGETIQLFVLAGHRNMEGERAFVQELKKKADGPELLQNDPSIAYRYSLGGGYKQSQGWEPLGPAGYYDTFGPELSFARVLKARGAKNIAIAKFTHSGSQIIDWTPSGSVAKSRNLFPSFVRFVRDAIEDLEQRGHTVELAGVWYHVGENDMSWGPFRRGAAERVEELIQGSRKSLELPQLTWWVSQQPPTDDERVNRIDVTSQLEAVLSRDPRVRHIKVFDLPPQERKLVIDTEGIVWLGKTIGAQAAERN